MHMLVVRITEGNSPFAPVMHESVCLKCNIVELTDYAAVFVTAYVTYFSVYFHW